MRMNPTSRGLVFRFEGFQLDRRRGLTRLTETGPEQVLLGSRAFDVLVALVERRGDLLTRQELMSAGWPETVVEDSNLAVQIFSLRRVLDRGRRGGSRIQTVIGRGYRFLPEVTLEVDNRPTGSESESSAIGPPLGDDATDPRGVHPPRDRRLSVVVLPFENGSDDSIQDGIAAGITRDVTTDAIAQGSAVPLLPTEIAAAYQGKKLDPRAIGRDQSVPFVLTGNARREDGQLIVTATLYQTEAGWPVWSRRYDCQDRPEARKFVVQSIIANFRQAMVDTEARRAMRARPDSRDKRDLVSAALAGSWSQVSKEKYHERISLAEQALAIDPNYVPALELDARVRAIMVLGGHSSDPGSDLARAATEIDRALLLAPDNYWVLVAKATVLRAQDDLVGAAALLRRVIDLRPSWGARYKDLGRVLLSLGQYQEALENLTTAKQLALGVEPAQVDDANLALALVANGRFPEAIAQARLAIAEFSSASGQDAELPWLALIAAESQDGQYAVACKDLQTFLATPRTWRTMAEFRKFPCWAASPRLLEGLRRAGMPDE
jgi:DNA-binding winged helix-turn-helix (wHTH) protein/TolB-like protein/Tfp pilus assembly protein PilF